MCGALMQLLCNVSNNENIETKTAMKTETELRLPRVIRAKQHRYNPLSGISDPAQIALKLDAFEVDRIKDAVNILEQCNDRIRAMSSVDSSSSSWRLEFRNPRCRLPSSSSAPLSNPRASEQSTILFG